MVEFAHPQDEVDDLRQEIERFRAEKERVRRIVGQIGGVPRFNTRLFNALFVLVIAGCLAASMFSPGYLSLTMVEVAVAAVSLKILLMMHQQHKVNHFQLWILSSLEWRLDQIEQELKSGDATG